ncbi:hypothetical protein [Micromonospora violae]|uniref:hypothetical protein n=1 Tax=Micromonospora violae TaxID=1278207 RepID=UPI0033F29BA3
MTVPGNPPSVGVRADPRPFQSLDPRSAHHHYSEHGSDQSAQHEQNLEHTVRVRWRIEPNGSGSGDEAAAGDPESSTQGDLGHAFVGVHHGFGALCYAVGEGQAAEDVLEALDGLETA